MPTILEALTTERNALSTVLNQLDAIITSVGTNGNGATGARSKGAPTWLQNKAKHARAIARFKRTMKQKRLAKAQAQEAAATFDSSVL